MTAVDRPGRRAFVGALVAGCIAGVAVGRDLLRAPDALADTPSAPAASDGVVVLGRAYLELHPDEADRAFLLGRLTEVDAKHAIRQQLPLLQPRIQRDYDAGRVVTVQGWQLSVSESRAAAAIALGA